MNNKKPVIDSDLVRKLVANQFPQWKDLPIKPVAVGGWDNRTFHLGEQMLVRMPSAQEYAAKVEIEQKWLPRLAPYLPLQIPQPLAMGKPGNGYPFNWSVYQWIKGETIAAAHNLDLNDCAAKLAQFLIALEHIDPTDGSIPGPHNFYRGGSLSTYDSETRTAIDMLKDKINSTAALEMWQTALASSWNKQPVWLHGDMSAGNLLVREGKLVAVIDFGGMAVGDPACDLAIAWTLFEGESRKIFCQMLPLDAGTWARGRAWCLWKALIIAAGLTKTNATGADKAWYIIDEVINDHKKYDMTITT